MKIDFEMLKALEKSGVFYLFKKVPQADNIFEYSIFQSEFGQVTDCLYLENEIVDRYDKTIGFFGINTDTKVFAYNIKVMQT